MEILSNWRLSNFHAFYIKNRQIECKLTFNGWIPLKRSSAWSTLGESSVMIWTLSKNPVNLSWFSKNFSSVKSGLARFGVLEQTTICQRQKNFKNFIFFKDVCSFTRQNWDWKVENSKLRQWEKRQKAWPECKQTYTEFFFFSAKKFVKLKKNHLRLIKM